MRNNTKNKTIIYKKRTTFKKNTMDLIKIKDNKKIKKDFKIKKVNKNYNNFISNNKSPLMKFKENINEVNLRIEIVNSELNELQNYIDNTNLKIKDYVQEIEIQKTNCNLLKDKYENITYENQNMKDDIENLKKKNKEYKEEIIKQEEKIKQECKLISMKQ